MELHNITTPAGRTYVLEVIQDAPRGYIASVRNFEDVMTAFIRFGATGYVLLDQDETEFGSVDGQDSAAALSLIFARFIDKLENVDAEDAEDHTEADVDAQIAERDAAQLEDDQRRNREAVDAVIRHAETVERIAGRVLIQLGDAWKVHQEPAGSFFALEHTTGQRVHFRISELTVVLELPAVTGYNVEQVELDRNHANPARMARIIAAFIA